MIIRTCFDTLAGAHMVRILPPWFENIGKRQIKAPKIYIRDSGILHSLFQFGLFQMYRGIPDSGLTGRIRA
jgi:hypothetical protein